VSVRVFKLEGIDIQMYRGDITEDESDAIVVPANSLLIMGGGVAGAVKRKGGREIEEEARKMAPIPVGSAVSTGAGKLKAKMVIHAPTMERPAGETDLRKIYHSTKAAAELAWEKGAKSLALPGMGTGVGGIDPHQAARAMLNAILDAAREGRCTKKINLVAFDERLYDAFIEAVSEQVEK